MIIFGISSLITAFCALVLGLFSYYKNKKSMINRTWFYTSIAIFIWSISLAFVVLSNNYSQANYWQYSLDFSSIWIPIFCFHFVAFICGKGEQYKGLLKLSYPIGIFVSIFSMTPFFREGLTSVAGFNYWVDPGVYYFISPFVYSIFVFLIFYQLIHSINKEAKGEKRLQLYYVLLAMVFGFGGGATNYLPQLFGIYPFGNYLVLLYVVFITYAIVKHRLMDVRLVVARSLSYATLLLILALFYAAGVLALERFIFPDAVGVSIYQAIFRISLTAIIAFSFQPIKKWVTDKTDRIFFKGQYNSEELLSVLSHILGSSIVLIELLYKVTDILMKDMRVSRSLFILLENENKIYTSQLNGYRKSLAIDPKDIFVLANQPMLALSELEYNSRLKSILNKYDAELSLPLKTDKGLLGVWLLGEKNSGEAYSQQDYQVFEIVIPEIAVAIENAKAYEEINKFNKTLKNEIEHATHKLEVQNSELVKTGRQLEDLVNFLPDATFAIDTTGHVIIWNKMIEDLTGTSADSIIGKGNRKFAHSFGYRQELTLAEQVLKGKIVKNEHYKSIRTEGDSLYAEVFFTNLNGKKAFLGAKAAPLYDQDRNVVGAIESLRDISDIKKVERILRKSNEELRKIDLAKDDFISMASHQLRTPITAIKGYLSMLIEGDAGEVKISQYDFILEAYRASNRMTGLVNDLLNVSRMEAGRFFLEVNEVDIDSIIEEEMKQLEGTIREKGLYFKYKKGKNIPNVSADKTKIRQVIMNFIDNSVYYTRKGGITIELYKEGDGVVFTVSDTGIGVPKNQQSRLFQKFYRADNAKNTRPDGTGLGLFLARKVIESHSGKIIFHSTEGVGSTFGFKIPIKNMAKKFSVVMPDVSSSANAISQGAANTGLGLVKADGGKYENE